MLSNISTGQQSDFAIRELIFFLVEKKILCREYVSLSDISCFETGGPLRLQVMPACLDDLRLTIAYCHEHQLDFRVFGAMSNCLFLNDCAYDVFITTKLVNQIEIDPNSGLILAQAGAMMPAFAKKISHSGFTGFEGLCGIPGTIGGGVYMNAGAYGNEMADHLVEVDVIDEKGELQTYLKEDLDFGFRHSLFQKKYLGTIAQARYQGVSGNHDQILKKISNCAHNRKIYQESRYSNLGSLFATIDIYDEILQRNPSYRWVILLNVLYWKILKPRNNKFINALTRIYFRWKFPLAPYSDKTLNCVINTGDNYPYILEYIETMCRITKGQLRIEIEIVQGRQLNDGL